MSTWLYMCGVFVESFIAFGHTVLKCIANRQTDILLYIYRFREDLFVVKV